MFNFISAHDFLSFHDLLCAELLCCALASSKNSSSVGQSCKECKHKHSLELKHIGSAVVLEHSWSNGRLQRFGLHGAEPSFQIAKPGLQPMNYSAYKYYPC